MPRTAFSFIFESKKNHGTTDDFILALPVGIKNKSELISCYAEVGHFPSYFGNNWDALNDCLRDFSWIRQRRIFIIHEDLPLSNNEIEIHVYLEILVDAIKLWKCHQQHELLVVFPEESENIVARLLDK